MNAEYASLFGVTALTSGVDQALPEGVFGFRFDIRVDPRPSAAKRLPRDPRPGSAALSRGRFADEGVEEALHARVEVDEVLGVPLDADHEVGVGGLDALDHAVGGDGGDDERRGEGL